MEAVALQMKQQEAARLATTKIDEVTVQKHEDGLKLALAMNTIATHKARENSCAPQDDSLTSSSPGALGPSPVLQSSSPPPGLLSPLHSAPFLSTSPSPRSSSAPLPSPGETLPIRTLPSLPLHNLHNLQSKVFQPPSVTPPDPFGGHVKIRKRPTPAPTTAQPIRVLSDTDDPLTLALNRLSRRSAHANTTLTKHRSSALKDSRNQRNIIRATHFSKTGASLPPPSVRLGFRSSLPTPKTTITQAALAINHLSSSADGSGRNDENAVPGLGGVKVSERRALVRAAVDRVRQGGVGSTTEDLGRGKYKGGSLLEKRFSFSTLLASSHLGTALDA